MKALAPIFLAAAAVAGCAPSSGVVTSAEGPEVGSVAPDVQYVSQGGTKADFNRARYPVAIVAFSAPEAADCCWLEPKVANLADEFGDLPVTVAQFSLPKGKCPHGQGCMEACNLRHGGLMSLCDGQRLAWKAYGRPAPGSLILIGPDNKILEKASLSAPGNLLEDAKRLGQEQKQRQNPRDRRDIY